MGCKQLIACKQVVIGSSAADQGGSFSDQEV